MITSPGPSKHLPQLSFYLTVYCCLYTSLTFSTLAAHCKLKTMQGLPPHKDSYLPGLQWSLDVNMF